MLEEGAAAWGRCGGLLSHVANVGCSVVCVSTPPSLAPRHLCTGTRVRQELREQLGDKGGEELEGEELEYVLEVRARGCASGRRDGVEGGNVDLAEVERIVVGSTQFAVLPL